MLTSLLNSLRNFICGIRNCLQTGGNCQNPRAWSPAEKARHRSRGTSTPCSVCGPRGVRSEQSTNSAPHSWGHTVPLGAEASCFLPNKQNLLHSCCQPAISYRLCSLPLFSTSLQWEISPLDWKAFLDLSEVTPLKNYKHKHFPGGLDSKSICLQCRRPGFNPWVRKIPWRRK